MTLRRCQGCAHFYEKKVHKACPECGTPEHGYNAGLYGSRCASNLTNQAAHADAQRRAFG